MRSRDRQLGGPWYLVVVTANHENDIVTTYINGTMLPISQIRNGTGHFVWSNKENATWFNWYFDLTVKRPGVAALDDCSHIDSGLSATWNDAACRAEVYQRSPCEADAWWYTGSVSFIAC